MTWALFRASFFLEIWERWFCVPWPHVFISCWMEEEFKEFLVVEKFKQKLETLELFGLNFF